MTLDLHREKAAEIFDVPPEQVTPAQREYAKMLNYVSNYSTPVDIHPRLLTRLTILKAKAKP